MKNIFFKMILIIMTIIVVCSCSVTHQKNAFFRIYESIDNGASDPTFIMLKNLGRTFEIYSPTMRITTVGMWETRGDTLIFSPSLDYTAEKGKLHIENLNDSIKTVTSISKQYIIKGDMIFDITNYDQIYPGFIGNEQPISSQYKMMK